MLAKQLILFNGRAYCCVKRADPFWSVRQTAEVNDAHAFVAAYSIADAQRLVSEYTGRPTSISEIKSYWSKNAWGNAMDGITPERGIWISFGNRGETPTKVYPAKRTQEVDK